jgi:hypothetical protein
VRRTVDAADAWAVDHLALLSASFESFATSEEWAPIEGLQHSFEVKGERLDVARLSWQMPRPLGFVEQGRLILLCRALLWVPDASALLQDWFLVLKYAYERWVDDRNFELTSDRVIELFGGDTGRAGLVSQLLLREGWMFGSGTGVTGGDWTRELRSEVRVARDAHNARDLLDARIAIEDVEPMPVLPLIDMDEPEVPAPAPLDKSSGPEDTVAQPGRLRRLWDYVSNNPLLVLVLGTLSVLAIVAALGLFYTGAKELVEYFNEDTGLAAHGKVERAGEGGARTFQVAGVLAQEGPAVKPGEKVRVLCLVYAPSPPSAVPDGNWYKLSSSPWNGRYFAAANSFWNGDVPGQLPYSHNTDEAVEKCH